LIHLIQIEFDYLLVRRPHAGCGTNKNKEKRENDLRAQFAIEEQADECTNQGGENYGQPNLCDESEILPRTVLSHTQPSLLLCPEGALLSIPHKGEFSSFTGVSRRKLQQQAHQWEGLWPPQQNLFMDHALKGTAIVWR